MAGGRRPAALHAGRSGPRDRRGRPSPRRKLSERPASEAQPARPSAVLAPSRVQRRGVEARRVSRRAWGGEARERRAGGSKNRDASGGAVLAGVRAARQRREVGTLILWPRSALLVTKYGGFNEVQETPPSLALASLVAADGRPVLPPGLARYAARRGGFFPAPGPGGFEGRGIVNAITSPPATDP